MSYKFNCIHLKEDADCPHCKEAKIKDFDADDFILVQNETTYVDSGYGDNDCFADCYYHFYQYKCPKCGLRYVEDVNYLGRGDEHSRYGLKVSDGVITDDSVSKWKEKGILKEWEDLPAYIKEQAYFSEPIPKNDKVSEDDLKRLDEFLEDLRKAAIKCMGKDEYFSMYATDNLHFTTWFRLKENKNVGN